LSSAPSEKAGKAQLLMHWYERTARNLPWRQTRDPYPVWVSEIMLQQTQVTTVLPRFSAWMARFPNIRSLAAAHEDVVMKAWEGLGYYRRARFLHTAARRIMMQYGGDFPRKFADILALPGIGRSTAGAIASICFGACTPVLDGNVKRVLRRWHGNPQATDTRLWQMAQAAIEQAAAPGLWNQAMMELGAIICTPGNPDCADCPVSLHCAAAFRAEACEVKRKTVVTRDVHWQVHIHLDATKGIWMTRRPDGGIWAGLWSPPVTEMNASPARSPCLIHTLTHRRLHLYGRIHTTPPAGAGCWMPSLSQVAVPTGMRRLLKRHGIPA